MRRILIGLVALLGLAVALPPLWFVVWPAPEPPPLPPAQRRVALPGGVRVHVVEAGRGAPVVLVHGLPGSAWDWRHTTEALAARGRHVFAYDRVGYGHSDPRPDDAFTVARNAEELVALLEALDLRDVTVVGWSYGGGTAILAAHRDPSRMARLVLVGSAGPGIEAHGPPLGVRLLLSDPVFAWMRAVPPVARALRRGMSEVAFSGQPQPDWWLPALDANFALPRTVRSWREEGRRMTESAPPDPAGLGLPVLVVHGDDDRLVPLAVGEALHRRAPHSELLVVEGGSHMLPVTHAARLADAIVRFEDEAGADEPPEAPGREATDAG